jgi:hypothetical protein
MNLAGFLLSTLATPAAPAPEMGCQWLLARNPTVGAFIDFNLVRLPKENYL